MSYNNSAMYKIRGKNMSFGFSNINPQFKAQGAYKDASGMGGGGMYFQQGKKKRKDQPDDDLFESKDDDIEDNEIVFDSDEPQEIPQESMYNKFVNWFRQNKT